ncbi:MAG: GyrI-like domain-containing protein [Proteobacteria bacterium]|nr:GyrI-like domain-containing protein [Pseudomonadota bacterium]
MRIFIQTGLITFFAASAVSAATATSSAKENKFQSYRIEIENLESQRVLVMKGKCDLHVIGELIGQNLKKIGEHLNGLHSAPIGPPFTRTLNMQNNLIEFETGFPVSNAVVGTTDFLISSLPKTTAAFTTHTGSQDTSELAYQAIHDWIMQNSWKETGAPWEVYLANPEATSPAESIMKIFYPVMKLQK